MPLDWRRERIAKNEASFREINERLEQGLHELRDGPDLVEFVCECGEPSCAGLVRLTLDEYEAVRSDPRRFAVLPGHLFPDAERSVRRTDRFEVVEKIGEAVRIAERTDPRRPD
jgi:hypothetical protein